MMRVGYCERIGGALRCRREDVRQGLSLKISSDGSAVVPRGRSLTARFSVLFNLRVVRGVFPRSFPGVLNMSATLLEPCQRRRGMSDASNTYIWFSEKISAICSLSHSTSFLAE